MDFKNANKLLNIIIEYDLNTIEVSIFQDALLLSQLSDEFVLNRHHLQFKAKVTRQCINKCISNLENKGVLEQIGKHGTLIQHKFVEGVFNV